ncbi:MAG: HAMP domain-containing sensor histidine kinase [Gemmatales bacterium]|nr:HAMP domain-containing histidine kinase [Gemmatales bacterium]MDW7995539.1 HAMP domain-containing sensor histidine kinase [Gemmatales bacterium]
MKAQRWREWFIGLAPPLFVLVLLALASGYAVYYRFYAEQAADERALREWLEEARVFRKTLPELCREYLEAQSPEHGLVLKQELNDHLQALAAPLRQYTTHLPLFPTLYRLELHFQRRAGQRAASSGVLADLARESIQSSQSQVEDFSFVETIAWDSGLPFVPLQVRRLEHLLVQDNAGEVRAVAWYQLHAFHHKQRLLAEQRRFTWGLVGLIGGVSVLAVSWVSLYFYRQRARERAEAEAQRRLAEVERQALEQKLLREKAEREALQWQSQIYEYNAIMAGTYAHNIKNLLVRPFALLRECLERPLDDAVHAALKEIESTLGTVTDRLQEILRTVRGDPTGVQKALVSLHDLAGDIAKQWRPLAEQRWKVTWHLELGSQELWVWADRSKLIQAVENLIFNARDATFEKRSLLRERAYRLADTEGRKQALIEAAAWRGEISLATYAYEETDSAGRSRVWAVLEVRDNGIGMTPEVRDRCTELFFTTKRDNAAYRGQSTGMGLGLPFVKLVVEQHGGELRIESEPQRGTRVRILLPLTTDHRAESPAPHYNHTPP